MSLEEDLGVLCPFGWREKERASNVICQYRTHCSIAQRIFVSSWPLKSGLCLDLTSFAQLLAANGLTKWMNEYDVQVHDRVSTGSALESFNSFECSEALYPLEVATWIVRKKKHSADICCNEANDLASFFWLALGPTLQNQQTKQHCKPSGPVASHPHYVQKDLSKTIQSFLGRSRSFAEETTLPTLTLPLFSSPSMTFPLMHEDSPNQWSAPFWMSHSCILMALSILTDSTEDDMSGQSGTRFQPRSPKACLVSWKVTNLWTTWLPSPRDGLNMFKLQKLSVCFNLLPPQCANMLNVNEL